MFLEGTDPTHISTLLATAPSTVPGPEQSLNICWHTEVARENIPARGFYKSGMGPLKKKKMTRNKTTINKGLLPQRQGGDRVRRGEKVTSRESCQQGEKSA